jgi:hypothetical protein
MRIEDKNRMNKAYNHGGFYAKYNGVCAICGGTWEGTENKSSYPTYIKKNADGKYCHTECVNLKTHFGNGIGHGGHSVCKSVQRQGSINKKSIFAPDEISKVNCKKCLAIAKEHPSWLVFGHPSDSSYMNMADTSGKLIPMYTIDGNESDWYAHPMESLCIHNNYSKDEKNIHNQEMLHTFWVFGNAAKIGDTIIINTHIIKKVR